MIKPPVFDPRPHAAELAVLARHWQQGALPARLCADTPALFSAHGNRSFGALHANANRLAHALRGRGLVAGDAVALMCGNRPEFIEVFLAAMRLGLRLTPINSHLLADETAYIARDCQARLLFVEAALGGHGLQLPGVAEVVIGQASYAAELQAASPAELALTDADPAGTLMLYTSGTTGRPKGVFQCAPEVIAPQLAGSFADYRAGDVQLCAGPAYHSAPLLFDLRWPLASGIPIVLQQGWDSVAVLALIEQHRISHAHLVPTMFARLLALPAEQRARFDLSSLRFIVHGAAPCPVAVKRAMIDWLGPVLTEYYAATEGGDGIHVDSHDWLRRPGTVGRLQPAQGHRIVGDDGRDVAPGDVGRIYFRAPPPEQRFHYFGDPAKTAAAYDGDAFTLGDLGRVDADGWLFLTGRGADTVISGGVNLYPAEVDAVLRLHPAVADVCTVGAPDDEWGERLVAVVVPAAGHAPGDELAAALSAHAAQHLAGFKRPKQIVFDHALPHSATGKLLRGQVRQRFWHDRVRSI